jgi:cellulose synthase/poly-beta-1,6-N-acetylglucosamine synthase-like glycosyltransferase
MMIFLFYLTLGLLLYSYAVYPLVLVCLPARRPESAEASEGEWRWPSVSVLVSVYNEEKVIAAKVANFLACHYDGPSEILIVSDGSTDHTTDVIRPLASDRVKLLVKDRREGKGVAMNFAVAHTRGTILVFTDANAFFGPDALSELVGPFRDPKIGLVTGWTVYTGGPTGSMYERYERSLKQLESRSGVVAGADGAIYAMRKSLWREHPPELINDFLHPMVVALGGAHSVIAERATCEEEFKIENEFSRQVRMVSQAALVLTKTFPALARKGQWRSLLVLASHKLARWLTVPLLALLLVATVRLAATSTFYRLVLDAELLFGLWVVVGWLAALLGADERVSLAYRFLVLNCAGAVGLWRCMTGRVPVAWQPRSQ